MDPSRREPHQRPAAGTVEETDCARRLRRNPQLRPGSAPAPARGQRRRDDLFKSPRWRWQAPCTHWDSEPGGTGGQGPGAGRRVRPAPGLVGDLLGQALSDSL